MSLGEEIDRVEGVWDLVNADLRGRQWPHADLSGLSLDGANCEGINLFAAGTDIVLPRKFAERRAFFQQCNPGQFP